ncbi:hypothetical protein MNBD_GAMMA14-840 [hydrothermal vent metagenome]|uniref:General secretion pathway GspH domain-containing protein n=1 Tax=hydrothermal vent metagenome TaxID=652676 RepID=A0A3B0Z4U7_9ZZZZ
MKSENGFTLIELMVTLAIAATLVTIGVPNLQNFVMNNRLITHANDFIGAIQLARSEAIKRQRNTELCISTTFASSPPTCTGGQDWTAGWIVWADNDRDTNISADEIIQVHEAFAGNASLTSAVKSQFRYNSIGLVDAAGTLTLCDSRTGEQGRQITISNAGRTSITNLACP